MISATHKAMAGTNKETKQAAHLKISHDRTYPRVLVCGAPERAERISKQLDGVKELAKNREYHSYFGKFKGQEILVTSHGVGASGAAICFHELMELGAKAIIRIGTAGALQDGLSIGDLVIATSAIRKDGVTDQLVPTAYPAVPSYSLTGTLIESFKSAKTPFKAGNVLTSAVFYPSLLDTKLAFYQKARAIAVEMECSTLFVMGLLNGIHTGSVLALDGNPLKWQEGVYDPNSNRMKENMDLAILRCLEALSAFDFKSAI